MIPKIIHYCWFGGQPKSAIIEKCISSWRKYCPEWQIIEWNESNFNVKQNQFCREAYDNKKWAFVSDYARFDVLNRFGGIYVDTDVEIIKPLDDLLHYAVFAGHETEKWVAPGLILGAEAGHPILKRVLDAYEDASFLDAHGSEIHTTVGEYFTAALKESGINPNGRNQVVDNVAIFAKDYFCPLNDSTGVLKKTKNTYTIHWYEKTWIDPKIRFRTKITRIAHRIFGDDCFQWLKRMMK